MSLRRGRVAAAVLVVVTWTPAARASDMGPGAPGEEGKTAYPLELGARAAYTTVPIRGGVNPFAAGFGVRIGYVVSHVYVGATATYYLGGSDVGATDQAILFAAVLGYDLHLGAYVILRPTLALGDAALSHSEPLSGVDVVTSASGATRTRVTTTVHDVYVQPALTWLLASGAHFVGIGAGALVVPGITYGPAPAQATTWISYSLEGELGFRF